MTVNKKIIDFLFENGLIQTKNPSTRDVANGIVGIYKALADLSSRNRHFPHPEAMMNFIRARIERSLDVVWENDIEPILKIIGFDWMAESEVVMQYWHPGMILHP